LNDNDSHTNVLLFDVDEDDVDEKTRAFRVLQEVVGTQVKMPVDSKEKSKRLFRY